MSASPSPTESVTSPPATVEVATADLIRLAAAFALFLVIAVGLIICLQFLLSRSQGSTSRRTVNVTLARVLGILGLATLGFFGVVCSRLIGVDGLAAYFTLLGTLAGYLVGARVGEKPTGSGGPKGGDGDGDGGDGATGAAKGPKAGNPSAHDDGDVAELYLS